MKAIEIAKNVVRILLGALFITSAILKLLSLDTFEVYIYSFHIVNFFLSELAARGVIMLEMVMGALLILKVDYKWTWRLALAVTIGFTLLLVYVALFRDDENCHCFGDIVELKPVPSIIKNILIILLFLFARKTSPQRLSMNRSLNEETGKKKFHLICTEDAYSDKFKRWCYRILLLTSFVATCVLFPPNNIYNAIFKKSNGVVENVFDKALQDSSLYLKIVDAQYDAKKDTITFTTDTCKLDIYQGNYLVAVMSAGCMFCRQSCALVNGIFESNGISPDKCKILIWGANDQHFAHYMRVTKTWQYEYRKVSPLLAIDMVSGSFPTFLFVEKGKITDATDYRGLSEKKLVDFLSEK